VSDGREGATTLWCRRSGKEYPGDSYLCPEHPGEELVHRPVVAAEPEPARVEVVAGRPQAVCWNCKTVSPNAANTTCVRCHESLVAPMLVIEFEEGSVVVRSAGQSVELGRAGVYSHVFARYPNVSRWHATVGVDAQGEAWLTPNPSAPNGTFLNGHEILERKGIGPGDQIRFAAGKGPNPGPVSQLIRQPHRE
jgi:hypothetical protein